MPLQPDTQIATIYILLNTAAAIATAAVFAYWRIRERSAQATAGLRMAKDRYGWATSHNSGHRRSVRLAIRLLMPLFAALLLMQLSGIVRIIIPLPAGLEGTLFVFGHAAFWSGVVLAVWARETLGAAWTHAADFQVIPNQPLIARGPYRLIRHPIYTGLVAMFIGIEMALSSWLIILAVALGWFAWWQAKKEEQLLTATFGQSYEAYQQQTGMFLPRLTNE